MARLLTRVYDGVVELVAAVNEGTVEAAVVTHLMLRIKSYPALFPS